MQQYFIASFQKGNWKDMNQLFWHGNISLVLQISFPCSHISWTFWPRQRFIVLSNSLLAILRKMKRKRKEQGKGRRREMFLLFCVCIQWGKETSIFSFVWFVEKTELRVYPIPLFWLICPYIRNMTLLILEK
jgi:hypothetical protein